MAHRLSFAVAIVPFVISACGDSKSSSGTSGGASGVPAAGTSSSSGGAKASSGGASANPSGGASLGGASSHDGGVAGHGSGGDRGGAAANGTGGAVVGAGGSGGSLGTIGGGTARGGESANGGAHAGESSGGGTSGAANSGGSVGDSMGGTSNAAGSGGTLGGIPSDWYVGGGVNAANIPGPNFDTVLVMFDGVPCYGSNCHKGGRNHLQVGKPPDELYTYMKGFTTLHCGKLIDTAHPSESALVKYLRGPCGGIERMPYYRCIDDGDAGCVPEYYIKAIEQWIANGAPR